MDTGFKLKVALPESSSISGNPERVRRRNVILLQHPSGQRSRIYGFIVRATLSFLLLSVVIDAFGGLSPGTDVTPVLDQQEILRFLNQAMNWHQQLALEQQKAATASDIAFADNDRSTADQVLRLSFDFARAAAQCVNTSGSSTTTLSSTDSRYQTLAQTAVNLDAQQDKARAKLEALRQKLTTAPPGERKAVQLAIAGTQSNIGLIEVQRDTLRSILQFLGGTAEPGGLSSQIEALERSVPIALTNQSYAGATPSNAAGVVTAGASARGSGPIGIWGIVRELAALSSKLQAIGNNIRETDELTQMMKKMQSPLVNQLRELARESETVLAETNSQDPTLLARQKNTLDGLAARYKLTASAALPLSEGAILLDVYKRNLVKWQVAAKSEYSASMKSLLIRLLGLGVVLGFVLAMFELWRRTIFRYVQDTRRRYQFLLLRRIVLWCVIALIIALGFASQLGSLVTFAGLMTAGVAVALQNVILAVVGYFMLIGKFGVHVGDRVQISGVSGEVVEIGMIRLHILELGGTEPDAQPTGRVVAFSNSVVFQPTAGLFRQVPGTDFLWHEITLTLVAESDYRSAERRMRDAVDAAFEDYLEDLERQRRQMEMNLASVSIEPLAPRVRFRFTTSGLEVFLRYPVEFGRATEMDERVTRELLHAIDQEPKLKIVGAEIPEIRVRTVGKG
jgi:small-conductance mechanosensitive channel